MQAKKFLPSRVCSLVGDRDDSHTVSPAKPHLYMDVSAQEESIVVQGLDLDRVIEEYFPEEGKVTEI